MAEAIIVKIDIGEPVSTINCDLDILTSASSTEGKKAEVKNYVTLTTL